MRIDGRKFDEMRKIVFETGYLKYPLGSVLSCFGDTKVICTATIDEGVPPFLKGTGKGWLTAEYSMIPGSTVSRKQRETLKVQGRTQEIQRLIGRCLRASLDFELLGEKTIWIDCDVIQADGGTRTAGISGGFVALVELLARMMRSGVIKEWPVKRAVAGVSVGIVSGTPVLDLTYEEDSKAEVDMNIVKDNEGKFIEIQGTSELSPFTEERLKELLGLAQKGLSEIFEKQREAIEKIMKENELRVKIGSWEF